MIALSCGRAAARQGAHAPPAEHVLRHQPLGHGGGLLRLDDPAVQAVPGVGGDARDLALASVERQRERSLLGVPERRVERFAQVLRLAAQTQLGIGVPECSVDLGDRELRAIDITLRLDQRDRALGETAVRVHDGVVRVLPSLVAQAGGRAALVLDEAIAVTVTELIDPPQR
jgi:hypothetical protein